MSNTYFDFVTEGISVPLTNLASGYRPQGLIGDLVFPEVTSVLKAGKFPKFGKDAFRIYQSLRARGARSNRITIEPESWGSFACEEHDLAVPLDKRELDELKAIPGDKKLKALFNLQDRQRKRIQWNLKLEREKVVADAVQDTSNYTGGNYKTLSGTGIWSKSGSSPGTDIEDGKEVIRGLIGMYPNTLILSAQTMKILRFHSYYTSMLKTTSDKIVREELIKSAHSIKNVYIGMSMTVDSDDNFVDLWGDVAILCYIPETTTPDLDEPGFGYTIKPGFSPNPYPYVDVFTEEGGKIVNVRCTDMYDTVFVNGYCGYLIKNTKE